MLKGHLEKALFAALLAFFIFAIGFSTHPQALRATPPQADAIQPSVGPTQVASREASLAASPATVAGGSVAASSLPSTPELLGSVRRQDVAIAATLPNVSWRITMAEDANGFGYDIGNNVPHYNGSAGTYNFTSVNDVDFQNVSALLTNGIDDPMEFVSSEKPFGAANWSVGGESSFFNVKPDFIGYAIDSYALVLYDLHIYGASGTALEFANYTWQVWGHRIFVAFTPPTDPSGAYISGRDYSNVTVSLAGDGNAVLEWDGTNRTMLGFAHNWHANVTNIPNGDHSYRVWANDTNGTTYVSERRQLTVAFHYWSIDNIGDGSGPSLTTDHQGAPHLCYEDPNGYVHYGIRTSLGWSVQTVAYGGAGYCSIAVDLSGTPHLLFGSLKYAVLDAGTWAISTIESVPITRGASLALNPTTGRPMVAFYDGSPTGHHLVFAQQAADSSWTSMIVDNNGDTGWLPSLVVNSSGSPQIAYSNSVGDIIYANLTGGPWNTSIINKSFPLSGLGRISLALDANETPHIAYDGGGPRYGTVGYIGLEYASLVDGKWTNKTIYPGPTQGVSLAFDAQNRPQIAFGLVGYPDPPNGTLRDLRYAIWNGSWRVATLSNAANATGIALSLSLAGLPEIAATSWWSGGGTNQGMLQFFTVSIGLFATFDSTPFAGNTSTVFRFDPSGSYDTYFSKASLQARWDFNGDGVWDTGWGSVGPVTQTYATSGRYTIFMQLRDPNNMTATAQKQVTVDSVPPVTRALLSGTLGSGGWYISSVSVTLSATDDLTFVSATRYDLDDAGWTAYAQPFDISANGNHTVRYYSVDALGNVEPVQSASVSIDTTPPRATITLSGTKGNAGWYTSDVMAALGGLDATSGLEGISYSIDGGAVRLFTNPFTLTDGRHSIDYSATDIAGNRGATQTAKVNVDTTPPELSIYSPSGTITIATVTVSWTASDDISGIADYQISVDNGSFQTLGNETLRATIRLADGEHTIAIRAVDAAGNPVTRETQVRVDTNFLSFTGPFKGVPTLALLLFLPFIAALLILFLWYRRREKEEEDRIQARERRR